MSCPSSPGFCESCNRRVRWCDIQSCRGPANGSESPKSCRDCIHGGPVLLDAAGDEIGSKGCGCTGESVASGSRFVTCNLTGGPVNIDKARRCGDFEST